MTKRHRTTFDQTFYGRTRSIEWHKAKKYYFLITNMLYNNLNISAILLSSMPIPCFPPRDTHIILVAERAHTPSESILRGIISFHAVGFRQCLIGATQPTANILPSCAFRFRFLRAYPPLEGHGATGRTADRPGGTFVEIQASGIQASGIQASGIQASGVWYLWLPFWGTRPSYPVLAAESAVAPSRWL